MNHSMLHTNTLYSPTHGAAAHPVTVDITHTHPTIDRNGSTPTMWIPQQGTTTTAPHGANESASLPLETTTLP